MSSAAEEPPLTVRHQGQVRAQGNSFGSEYAFSERDGSGVGLGLALLCAALLHASLLLIKTESRALSDPKSLVLDDLELQEFKPPDTAAQEPDPLPPQIESSRSESPISGALARGTAQEETVDVEVEVEGSLTDEAAEILSSDPSDTTWAALSGTGTTLGGGLSGRPGRATVQSRETVLAARDLSRKAKAPDLDPLVQRNFPTAARMASVGGTVTVSAWIAKDGTPSDVRVESVTPQGRGFGETCSRTVHQGPSWKPELNRDGRPVASRVTYTCHFRLPKATDSAQARPQEATSPHIFHRAAR